MRAEPEPAVPSGGRPLGDPAWAAWSPDDVRDRLCALETPWCVAAGWALDLFRGEVTRAHEDLEIAVPCGDFSLVRDALGELEFDVVGAERHWPVDSPAYDVMHQTWGREPSTGVYRLDVFREPHDGDTWICRRDESIRLPYASVVRHSAAGIPYMAPEIVLLFKAKHARDKDVADFDGVLPLLESDARGWLGDALQKVHPGHPWSAALAP